MPRSRKVVVLVVVAILALPWASFAGPRQEIRPAVTVSDVFDRLWGLVQSIWTASGCRIDPNGGEPEPQPTIDIDEGCHIDPSGGCRS